MCTVQSLIMTYIREAWKLIWSSACPMNENYCLILCHTINFLIFNCTTPCLCYCIPLNTELFTSLCFSRQQNTEFNNPVPACRRTREMFQCFNPRARVRSGAPQARPRSPHGVPPAPPLGGASGPARPCSRSPLRALRCSAHARPGPAGRLRGRGGGGGRSSLEARQVRAAGAARPRLRRRQRGVAARAVAPR